MDLVVLVDGYGNSVRVGVLGRYGSRPDVLAAEIVVETPFVSGRIGIGLWVARLDAWAECLDSLDAGEDIAWMEMERGASLFIQLTGERECPEVVVDDESGSMVTVRVPFVLPEDWTESHRQRLRALRAAWNPGLSA